MGDSKVVKVVGSDRFLQVGAPRLWEIVGKWPSLSARSPTVGRHSGRCSDREPVLLNHNELTPKIWDFCVQVLQGMNALKVNSWKEQPAMHGWRTRGRPTTKNLQRKGAGQVLEKKGNCKIFYNWWLSLWISKVNGRWKVRGIHEAKGIHLTLATAFGGDAVRAGARIWRPFPLSTMPTPFVFTLIRYPPQHKNIYWEVLFQIRIG